MAEPIRILQVFARMDRGGAETMIMNIYRKINRNRVQFDFIVHTEDKCSYDDEIRSLGGNIYRLPRYLGKNHYLYVKKWKDFLSTHPEYRIVHAHVRSTASIYLKICKEFDLITIAHSHSTSSGYGLKSHIKKMMQYPIRRISDYYFACSISAGKWLFGNHIVNNKNFFVLNNSIESKSFEFNENKRQEIRDKFNIKGKFVVGHIGRFDVAKNQDFIIEIFKEIKFLEKNATLVLIGEGELKNKIQKKVYQYKLSNDVIFTGVRNDVPDLLQSMDVFLFPSLYEGLGIAAVEAQAAGLPTIVSERLPEEVFITNLIEREYLNSSAKVWANRVIGIANRNIKREIKTNDIKQASYDINETGSWLENFYVGLV